MSECVFAKRAKRGSTGKQNPDWRSSEKQLMVVEGETELRGNAGGTANPANFRQQKGRKALMGKGIE